LKNIVLIDDDRLITVLVKAFLKNSDINLVTFNCPQQGLEYILNHKVDMCITDLMMPKLSGFDICNELLEKMNTVKLAVLSLKKLSINELHYLLDNNICYFNKPLQPKKFRAHLESLIYADDRYAKTITGIYAT